MGCLAKCVPQTFPNFTAECIQALLVKVRAEGVGTEGKAGGQLQGTAAKAGFEITWAYAPAVESLTIQCTSSPFLVPCGLINAQITSWVMACYPRSLKETRV